MSFFVDLHGDNYAKPCLSLLFIYTVTMIQKVFVFFPVLSIFKDVALMSYPVLSVFKDVALMSYPVLSVFKDVALMSCLVFLRQGVSQMLYPDQPSMCLVSNGAELIVLSKRLFLERATDASMRHIRQTVGAVQPGGWPFRALTVIRPLFSP